MTTDAVQFSPPSFELNADIKAILLFTTTVSIGTTTVPFGCTSGWPPIPCAESAVGSGGPHVSPPSEEVLIRIRSELNGIVPLQIAIAVMRTARPAVAGNPVFVGACGGDVRTDWILPSQPIGRPADDNRRCMGCIRNRQRRDHPHSMLRVIGNGRIAGRVVRPRSLARRQAG